MAYDVHLNYDKNSSNIHHYAPCRKRGNCEEFYLTRPTTECIQRKVDAQMIGSKLAPISILFAISLVLSNKAYVYLSVSYIQVEKK